MKKINSKGFTLIELLAVITIMGILMMVAIPSISRTIENSRRDTFSDVGKSYINAVRNAVLADELQCDTWSVAATPDGTYYFKIDSGNSSSGSNDLMESGGKSSWGNADVKGYVVWRKTTTPGGSAAADKTKTIYKINLYDTGSHGTRGGEVQDDKLGRSQVDTKLGYNYASGGAEAPTDSGAVECTIK